MTIIGIGSDIVKVSRIEKLVERYNQQFLKRIFTITETNYATSKARPAIHFAARFAAKEAFVKALGSGFRQGLKWTDIEVVNNALGQPQLQLHNYARQVLCKRGTATAWLTLSHEQDFALAFVVLEAEKSHGE